MKSFKFLNKNKTYNHDDQVIRYINHKMRNNLLWRGGTDLVIEDGKYYTLSIISGIRMAGMFHVVYDIAREGNSTTYILSVDASQIENPFE